MIYVRNVTYRYPNGYEAIKNITLEIDTDVTVLIGPNGAGKTTLLKILALIYKPQIGEVIIDSNNYWELPRRKQIEIRRNIIYLHENPKLFTGTVLDNVTYPLLIRGFNKKDAEHKAAKLLEELGIEEIAQKKKDLSAGEAQLVAYARAVVTEPKYLLLDEPTNKLDQSKRKKLESHLKGLINQGTKVVIATHDRLLALRLAKRIITIESGKLTQQISPKQLLQEVEKDLRET